jgi:hypothetical protein
LRRKSTRRTRSAELAEAQACVGQEADDVAVFPGRLGQDLDLVPGEEAGLVANDAGKRHTLSGIARDPAVADGQVEQQREDAVGVADGAGC